MHSCSQVTTIFLGYFYAKESNDKKFLYYATMQAFKYIVVYLTY